jgi:hypothetical protein
MQVQQLAAMQAAHPDKSLNAGLTSCVAIPSPSFLALPLLTVYFGAPSMFITLWFGFDYGTNPPLGTLII